MMNYNNTREFISEIEKRPALWDMSLKEYSNRDFKRTLWREVANLFSEADSTEKDKKELRLNLQKKWKNIRDSFAREVRRIRNSANGLDSVRKSPYVYYENMLFLKTTVHNSTNAKNLKQETSNLLQNETTTRTPFDQGNREASSTMKSPQSFLHPESSSTIRLNRKRKQEACNGSEELINALCKTIQAREDMEKLSEADEDRMFLLSLLPELKKISDDLKFPTKMEIMNVIQKAKTSSNCKTETPTYCQLTPVHPTYLGVASYENLSEHQFHTVQEFKPSTVATITIPNEENSHKASVPKEEILDLF